MNQSRSLIRVQPFQLDDGINWVILTSVLLLAPYVTAQTGNPPPPPPKGYTLNPKIKVSPPMVIILVCLIGAFLVMGCISIYVRQCAERFVLSSNIPTATTGRLSRRGAARGLDPAVVDSFPMFVYSEVKRLKIGKTALECAVCLNEFEDDESLRLLPKCCHVFHPDCIDTWLSFHVTCPVCRANLLSKPGELRPVNIPCQDPYDDLFVSNRSPEIQIADDLIIEIEPPELINPTQLPNQNRPRRSTPPKARTTGKFPRSHSTGHSVVQPGDDCERFTLRLTGEVRSQLVNSSLSRTKSCVAFQRVRSSRKGYRSRSGGTYERFDREGRSDRWGFTMTPPFFSRASSSRLPKGGGDDLTATPKRRFRSVRSPFDRLFAGTDKDNVGERSFDKLRSDG